MASQPKFRADVAYHRCLEDTSYGHALYKQVLSSDLKPGTVGKWFRSFSSLGMMLSPTRERIPWPPRVFGLSEFHVLVVTTWKTPL
jgi:hypothetical protein